MLIFASIFKKFLPVTIACLLPKRHFLSVLQKPELYVLFYEEPVINCSISKISLKTVSSVSTAISLGKES